MSTSNRTTNTSPGAWRRSLQAGVLLLATTLVLAGCRKESNRAQLADGRTVITVWAHHGKPDEWRTIQEQVARFNQSQDHVFADLVEIAEANYDTQVQSAAASGKLPDVLEFDGPMLANYAWKGYIVPISGLLDPELESDLLPSIVKQGTYAGNFYAAGTFDSGLGLFANRSMLEKAGARIPEGIEDAWTISEFNDLLHRLAQQEKESGADGRVLDLKRDYRGEWWTYGFYPILVSAGADLINREDYQSASGTLNSTEAVDALQHVQDWFNNTYVDPNTDGRAFIDARVAISWVGHWDYPRYQEALGDDLVVLPLPDFDQGTRTGLGSWAWAITRNCTEPEAAAQFLEFLLQPEEILDITAANGAVPATQTAIERSGLYQKGGPLRLYADQLKSVAVPRPKTPAYPVITSVFQEAMQNIIQGAAVQQELDRAARLIDEDIRDNQGYPPPVEF